jgi:hypothetical protein
MAAPWAAIVANQGESPLEAWVERALKRWPNVPALYGWLSLDRRGRWLIQGETIGRHRIVDAIGKNYGVDKRGCWYFQNGPQRGYMQLARAPFIVHVGGAGELITHNKLVVNQVRQVFLDEQGGLFLTTEHGPAALLDSDLDWALSRMVTASDSALDLSAELTVALAQASGTATPLSIRIGGLLKIVRLNSANAPAALGFVSNPQP